MNGGIYATMATVTRQMMTKKDVPLPSAKSLPSTHLTIMQHRLYTDSGTIFQKPNSRSPPTPIEKGESAGDISTGYEITSPRPGIC
jgi:hypothetical protein